MIDVLIADLIVQRLEAVKATLPGETLKRTVVDADGKVLILDQSVPSAYEYGLVTPTEPTHPSLYLKHNIIASANDAQVILSYPYMGEYALEVGDKVEISPGPLKSASIYLLEPTTVNEEVANGVKDFIIVSSEGEIVEYDSVSARHAKGSEGMSISVPMQVSVESLRETGINLDTSLEAVYHNPIFKEQVRSVIMGIRHGNTKQLRYMIPNAVSTTYEIWAREKSDSDSAASQDIFNVAILEFTVVYK